MISLPEMGSEKREKDISKLFLFHFDVGKSGKSCPVENAFCPSRYPTGVADCVLVRTPFSHFSMGRAETQKKVNKK